MADQAGVVIIGGGQAGVSAAAELRKRKYEGPVALLAGESDAPYQRPPLSKGYLSGDTPRERLWLKSEAWYDNADVSIRTGARVAAIDRAACEVVTAEGERLAYDHLVLATGGTARRLPIPGGDLHGVHLLRSLADADGLAAALMTAGRIVIARR